MILGHALRRGATPRDHRVLPKRIILVRHAESQGNIDHFAYSEVPDPQICLVLSLQPQCLQSQISWGFACILYDRTTACLYHSM